MALLEVSCKPECKFDLSEAEKCNTCFYSTKTFLYSNIFFTFT